MTFNQMQKKDFDEIVSKLDIKAVDIPTLLAIRKVLDNELNLSLIIEGHEPHLTPRNYVCINNCIKCLKKNDIINAWWEMTDIVSYKKPDDYVTTNELALILVAFDLVMEKLVK